MGRPRRSGQRAPRRGSASSSTARRRAPRRTTDRTATTPRARRTSQLWRGAALPSCVAMACAREQRSATAVRVRAPRSIRAAAMRRACSSQARSAASSTSAVSLVPAGQSRRRRCAPRATPAVQLRGRATLQRLAAAPVPRAQQTPWWPSALRARPPLRLTVVRATVERATRTKSSAKRSLRGVASLERSPESSAASRAIPTALRVEP